MKVYPFFFFNDTATTEIYTLSLHDALPICIGVNHRLNFYRITLFCKFCTYRASKERCSTVSKNINGNCLDISPYYTKDRKSTRLNSSHANISYAVFCLKKKKNKKYKHNFHI